MNVAKSMRHCLRLLRQRGTTKVLQNLQALAVRNYRSDDYDGYGWRGAEPSGKIGMQDTESRRRHFTQGIEDHRRRQSQIIMDNKRRWEQRSMPKSPILHNYAAGDVYARQNKGKPRHNKQDNQEAEKYSRRRRHQRQKEVKRQERELRESRKGYKLPKAQMQELEYHQEEEEEEPRTPRTRKTRATNEREWMEHQRREEEQKYWHSWHSCPNQRRNKIITLNEDEEPSSGTGYSHPSDAKFTWPKLPHDGSVRRYQTSSQQLAPPTPPAIAPPNSQKVTTHKRRRLSSMDKQRYSKNKHALPQPIFKRLEKEKEKQKQKKTKARKSVQPPRYTPQYTPKSMRPSTPGDSFSNMLALNTRDTPHSEYTGYLRQTVGDIWKNFIANHKARPTSSQKHA